MDLVGGVKWSFKDVNAWGFKRSYIKRIAKLKISLMHGVINCVSRAIMCIGKSVDLASIFCDYISLSFKSAGHMNSMFVSLTHKGN